MGLGSSALSDVSWSWVTVADSLRLILIDFSLSSLPLHYFWESANCPLWMFLCYSLFLCSSCNMYLCCLSTCHRPWFATPLLIIFPFLTEHKERDGLRMSYSPIAWLVRLEFRSLTQFWLHTLSFLLHNVSHLFVLLFSQNNQNTVKVQ